MRASHRHTVHLVLACSWILCLAVALGGLVFHMVTQIAYFVDSPRATNLHFLDEFPFPQITMCKKQRFVGSKVAIARVILEDSVHQHSRPPLNISFDEYTDRLELYFKMALGDVSEKKRLIRGLRRRIFHLDVHALASQTIWFCNFLGRVCSHLNFKVVKHPEYFTCLQLVPPTEKEIEELQANGTLTNEGGTDIGLRIYLANWPGTHLEDDDDTVDEKNFEFSDLKRDGFLISFDSPGQRARADESMFPLHGSKALYLEYRNISLKSTYSQPCEERGPTFENVTYVVDWDKNGKPLETETFVGTEEDCIVWHVQRFLLEKCGCVDGLLDIPTDLGNSMLLCGDAEDFLLNYDTLHQNTMTGRWLMRYGNVSYDYEAEVDNLGIRERYACFRAEVANARPRVVASEVCRRSCQSAAYFVAHVRDVAEKPESETFFISSTRTKGDPYLTQWNISEIRDQSMWLMISFNKRMNPLAMMEEYAYSWPSFLADIGGLLGLWIGASVSWMLKAMQLGAALWSKRRRHSPSTCSGRLLNVVKAAGSRELVEMEENWMWLSPRWLILVLMALFLVATGTHTLLQVLSYQQQTTSINIETVPQSSTTPSNSFPHLVICPLRPWNRQLAESRDVNLIGGRRISFVDYLSRIRRFQWIALNSSSLYPLTQMIRRDLVHELNILTFPVDEVWYCRYQGSPCTHEDFRVVKHPQHILCYQFIPFDRISIANVSSSSGDESHLGLQVIFANWERLPLSQTSHDHSSQLYLVSFPSFPDSRPTFEAFQWDASMDGLQFMEVGYRSVIQLSSPDYPCSSHTDHHIEYQVDRVKNETISFRASTEDCRINAAQHVLHRRCGCVDGYLYVPVALSHVPFCLEVPEFLLHYRSLVRDRLTRTNDWVMWHNNVSYSYQEEIQKSGYVGRIKCYEEVRQSQFHDDSGLMASCMEYCHAPEYFLQTMYRDSAVVQMMFGLPKSYVQDSPKFGVPYGLFLHVVMSKSAGVAAEVLREEWTYTLASLWSHLGGILALWMDANVFLVLQTVAGLTCFGVFRWLWPHLTWKYFIGDTEKFEKDDIAEPDNPEGNQPGVLELTRFLCVWVRRHRLYWLWGAAWCLLWAALLAHVATQLQMFMEEPTALTFERSHEPPFPVLLFCKRSWVLNQEDFQSARLNLTEGRPEGAQPRRLTLESYFMRLMHFYNFSLKDHRQIVRYALNYLRRYAFHPEMFNLSLNLTQDILYCRFRGVDCSSYFRIVINPEYLLCYQFEPPLNTTAYAGELQYKQDDFLEVGISDRLETRMIDKYEGLTEILNVKLNPHNFDLSGDEVIHLRADYNSIIHIAYRQLNKLSTSRRPCKQETRSVRYVANWQANTTMSFPVFLEDDCMVHFIQRYLSLHCGCVDVQLFVPVSLRNAPQCHETSPFLLHYDVLNASRDSMLMWYGNQSFDYAEEVQRHTKLLQQRFQCHRLAVGTNNYKSFLTRNNVESLCTSRHCQRNIYRFTRSTTLPLTDKQMLFVPPAIKRGNRTLDAKLTFGTFNLVDEGRSLKEELAFPLSRLLVNIGEILGLWIGLSFIGVLVFVRRVYKLVLVPCWRFARMSADSLHSASSDTQIVGDETL